MTLVQWYPPTAPRNTSAPQKINLSLNVCFSAFFPFLVSSSLRPTIWVLLQRKQLPLTHMLVAVAIWTIVSDACHPASYCLNSEKLFSISDNLFFMLLFSDFWWSYFFCYDTFSCYNYITNNTLLIFLSMSFRAGRVEQLTILFYSFFAGYLFSSG